MLRGARERKLRLALTVSAIVIGVTFLSGTLVLTATVRQAIRDQNAATESGLAVAVLPQPGFGDRVSLPASLVAQIQAVPGTEATEGQVIGPIAMVGPRHGTPRRGRRVGRDLAEPEGSRARRPVGSRRARARWW